MESFAMQTKKKLYSKQLKGHCCRRAFLFGLFSVLLREKNGEYSMTVPFEEMTEPTVKSIREQCGRSSVQSFDNKLKRNVLSFDGASAFHLLLDASNELSLKKIIPKPCPNCKKSFLRGVFIGCGRMIPPASGYSLELDCRERLPLIATLTEEEGIVFHQGTRRGQTYLYLKKSTSIEDFFTLIGDQELSFAIMNEKIAREFRNHANRVASCESNNIAKTVVAAGEQIDLIERLQAADKFSLLPPELQQAALARLENREASLEHLARLMTPPLTKSGLNHRLQKVRMIAKQLLEESN